MMLDLPRLFGLAGARDGIGRGAAAVGVGPQRGRVPGALRDRGGVPRGAVRDALARGARLPGLRRARLLRAEGPQGGPGRPAAAAGLAVRARAGARRAWG